MTSFMAEVCQQLDKLGVRYKYVGEGGFYYETVYLLDEKIGLANPNYAAREARFFAYENHLCNERGHFQIRSGFNSEDLRNVKDKAVMLFILQYIHCVQSY